LRHDNEVTGDDIPDCTPIDGSRFNVPTYIVPATIIIFIDSPGYAYPDERLGCGRNASADKPYANDVAILSVLVVMSWARLDAVLYVVVSI
jgi:hypothetical protein